MRNRLQRILSKPQRDSSQKVSAVNSRRNSTDKSLSQPSFSNSSSTTSIYPYKQEGVSIYLKDDPKYKLGFTKTNPVIDNELHKHKIIIEDRYT
jgi:hypothetical protein